MNKYKKLLAFLVKEWLDMNEVDIDLIIGTSKGQYALMQVAMVAMGIKDGNLHDDTCSFITSSKFNDVTEPAIDPVNQQVQEVIRIIENDVEIWNETSIQLGREQDLIELNWKHNTPGPHNIHHDMIILKVYKPIPLQVVTMIINDTKEHGLDLSYSDVYGTDVRLAFTF